MTGKKSCTSNKHTNLQKNKIKSKTVKLRQPLFQKSEKFNPPFANGLAVTA
jgi:hypothetical protein